MSLSSNYPTVRPSLVLDFQKAEVIDPRITFTRSSIATRTNSYGVLETVAANVPRIDFDPTTLLCNGLLIENQRTNNIRNNTMQGAVAGSPGTAPTNWQVYGTTNGLTQTIVGTGTENGITYIDIKYAGTSAGSQTNGIYARPESNTQIAASSGQSWTQSVYASLVGGSLSNVTITVGLIEYSGAGAALAGSRTTITPTSAGLATQRYTHTRALTNASTAFVVGGVEITFNAGVAIDITLRIGLPQLELGAFASSVIPTTTTALTRETDIATMSGANFSSWYNAGSGTLFAEGTVVNNISGTTARTYAELGNAAGTERLNIEARSSTATRARSLTGGATVTATVVYNALGINAKVIGAYGSDGITATAGGLTPATAASNIPAPDTLYLGTNFTATAAGTLNGTLRRITYYPFRLPDAQLQALTGT